MSQKLDQYALLFSRGTSKYHLKVNVQHVMSSIIFSEK